MTSSTNSGIRRTGEPQAWQPIAPCGASSARMFVRIASTAVSVPEKMLPRSLRIQVRPIGL
ncbi:MAG TPA: hypothetical protein VF062_04560 [Candidatus Limnocylindrales bacterium]